ncbi:MAG TPA: hypothetical protein VH277_13460 [Gemmatimonadaceae bacterium]|jgi:hypothetical protein|nr:hypothetical protein [Gemmatimonadaceae bacterium]
MATRLPFSQGRHDMRIVLPYATEMRAMIDQPMTIVLKNRPVSSA